MQNIPKFVAKYRSEAEEKVMDYLDKHPELNGYPIEYEFEIDDINPEED